MPRVGIKNLLIVEQQLQQKMTFVYFLMLFSMGLVTNTALIEEALIQNPEWVDRANKYGQTLLFLAAGLGHVETVKILIKLGSKAIDTPDDGGRTPLHWASIRGGVEMVDALIRLGSQALDTPDASGCAPLALAAGFGHADVVETLVRLESQALDTPDASGRTPMVWAVIRGHDRMLETLRALGADTAKVPQPYSRHEFLAKPLDMEFARNVRKRVYFAHSLTEKLCQALE